MLFNGTLSDIDTDQSFLSLSNINITFSNTNPSSGFLSLDNTFFNNAPGLLVGDPASQGPFFNSCTGPIFGIDIAPFWFGSTAR